MFLVGCCCTADERSQGVVVVDAGHLAANEKLADTGATSVEAAAETSQAPESLWTRFRDRLQPRDCAFDVKLRRENDKTPWGMKLDYAGQRAIHVCEVRTGPYPVAIHNVAAEAEHELRPGDYIFSVNGQHTETEFLQLGNAPPPLLEGVFSEARKEIKSAMVLELRVYRPQLFQVNVQRKGESMGLELDFSTTGTSLSVVSVRDGAVQKSLPEILSGDRIVKVNGQEGSPERLLAALKVQSDTVHLEVSRCPS